MKVTLFKRRRFGNYTFFLYNCLNKSRREMNEEEADIKIIIGKAFYTKLEEIWLKKTGRFGQCDSRPTVLILLELSLIHISEPTRPL